MKEELEQFERNQIWTLIERPKSCSVIGTKWVFQNKINENKARFVAQGYLQQEGNDYDETFAPVARLESIQILLVYASLKKFKFFKWMFAFLNSLIKEEVFVKQPLGFENPSCPDYVFQLSKAIYGLKQVPKLV